MSYLFKLFHDELAPGAVVMPGLEAQHTITYVWKGSAEINGKKAEADSAVYSEDFAAIKAGPQGATLWRWELAPDIGPVHLLKGDGVNSIMRLSRRVKMFELVPTSKWMFRLDSVLDCDSSTGLHSHPGSGIRCLLRGNLHVESEKGECSDNREPGDAWYEEGSYPVVSTPDEGVKATFVRGMVLPPEYINVPNSPNWIGGIKPCKSDWKLYFKKVITLR